MKSWEVVRRAWRETLTDWSVEGSVAHRRSWLWRAATTGFALARVTIAALALGPAPRPPGQPTSGRRSWMDTMTTDLRIVARSLRRSPWFASTAIATVALSMVLATTTFAVVDGVLFKPLPYPEADRLFAVYGAMNRRGAERMSFSTVDLDHWRTVPGVRFATFQQGRQAAGLGDSVRPIRVAEVDKDFFDVLGQRPLIGGFQPVHFEVAFDAPRAVLLGHALWRSAFGGHRDVVGLRVASSLPFPLVVAGVLPSDFVFPVTNGRDVPDVIVPLIPGAQELANSRNKFLAGIARLERGVQADATRQALNAVADAHRADVRAPDGQPAGFEKVTFEALTDAIGRYERTGFRLAFWATAALVLLACLNVAGLVAARRRERVRELTVRVALGAGRRDLLRLLLLESVLIGLFGGAVGAALAWPALAGISTLLPSTLVYLKPPAIDWRVLVFALGASTLCVVLVTLPASLIATRRSLRDRLAGDTGSTARHRTAGRYALVTAETALGMVLVLGGALFLASFIKLAASDSGFSLDRTARLVVLTPRLNELLAEARRTPGVVGAAATDAQLMQGGHIEWGYLFPKDLGIGLNSARVTGDYFNVAGVRLVEGRLPTQDEIDAKRPVMVISDILAARAWPGQSAIGRVISQSPMMMTQLGDATIVGVVADTRLQSLDEGGSGDVYLPLPEPQRPSRFTLILRTSGDPNLVAANVARRLRGWDSRVSVTTAESLRTSVWGSVKPRTFNTVLYGSLAAAALILVTVGIAGLVATAVARRQREIGIRMALGADRHRVRRLVVAENVRPVIVGLGIGSIASYWTAELVKANLYNTTPYDWTVWTATIATVLGAATIAAYIPARRASRVNPISVLRAE